MFGELRTRTFSRLGGIRALKFNVLLLSTKETQAEVTSEPQGERTYNWLRELQPNCESAAVRLNQSATPTKTVKRKHVVGAPGALNTFVPS